MDVRHLCLLACAALATACSAPPQQAHQHPAPAAAAAAPPPTAAPPSTAIVRLVNAQGQPAGRVLLTETGQGVQMAIEVQGLPPGPKGFHFHRTGACQPGPAAATGQLVPFGAAGPHFDPGMSNNHGQPNRPRTEVHAGDNPNIPVGPDGRGMLRHLNTQVTLAPGPNSVMGRALIVHAQPDDFQTDPSGNSGGRVLCGLVQPAQPGPVTGRAVIEHANAYPEGIAIDSRGNVYVGSATEGHIWRLAPGAAKAEMFQEGGSFGRAAALGMKVDARNRLWVAGGAQNTVSVIDLANGATLAILKGPQGSHAFVNDLVPVADGSVYVTDSFRPILLRGRHPGATLEPWLDLTATPIRYVPNQINLNGIVANDDGRILLAIQTVTGQLWRIDTGTRTVTPVPVAGADLRNGDGLLLRGAELFVLRNHDDEIVRLQLAPDWTSARAIDRLSDPRLKYPTTAVATQDGLMVVNAQLDRQKAPPPLLPFDLVTLAWPG